MSNSGDGLAPRLTRRYGHLQLPACLLLTSFPMPRPVPAALPPAPATPALKTSSTAWRFIKMGRRLPVRLLRPRTLFRRNRDRNFQMVARKCLGTNRRHGYHSGKDTANATVSVLSVMSLAAIRCWASPQEIGSKSSTTGRNFGEPRCPLPDRPGERVSPTITLTSTLKQFHGGYTDPQAFPSTAVTQSIPTPFIPIATRASGAGTRRARFTKSDGKTVWVD